MIEEMEKAKKAMKGHSKASARMADKEEARDLLPMANGGPGTLTPLIAPEPVMPVKKPTYTKNGNVYPILGNEQNLDDMGSEDLNNLHEKLISVILSEEEDLITNHRSHVDRMCDFSRTVMG